MNFVRRNDTMAIVGFAPNTRQLSPWNNPTVDLFGINEGYSFKWWKQKTENVAGWFQLHKRESFMRPDNHNDSGHSKWLRKKHNFPIFMQDVYSDIPSSVRFPIEDIVSNYGRYWRSTLAYIIAWAQLVGYKRLEIYGFEMASDSEYWGQRANACYIIGKVKGKGMDIYVPPLSRLLTGIRYAYDNNLVGLRQDLETNLKNLGEDKNKVIAEAEGLQGEYFLLEKLVEKYPDLAERKKKVSEDLKGKDKLIQLMTGRAQGITKSIQMIDTFEILEQESIDDYADA